MSCWYVMEQGYFCWFEIFQFERELVINLHNSCAKMYKGSPKSYSFFWEENACESEQRPQVNGLTMVTIDEWPALMTINEWIVVSQPLTFTTRCSGE